MVGKTKPEPAEKQWPAHNFEDVTADQVRLNPNNPQEHTPAEIDAMAAAIRRFGV